MSRPTNGPGLKCDRPYTSRAHHRCPHRCDDPRALRTRYACRVGAAGSKLLFDVLEILVHLDGANRSEGLRNELKVIFDDLPEAPRQSLT